LIIAQLMELDQAAPATLSVASRAPGLMFSVFYFRDGGAGTPVTPEQVADLRVDPKVVEMSNAS
jgi:hypothetical protein